VTRILIADDSPAVRGALVKLLGAAHTVELIEVENGEAALSRALELRPDLVILDLAMPIMDGLTAAREISTALPGVSILMYTMHSTPALELAAQSYGVRHVVAKGDTGELLAAIGQLLPAEANNASKAEEAPVENMANPAPAVPGPGVIAAENGVEEGVQATDLSEKKRPEN
jgi:DNA-binding NarL/FixJ family response regulator